jgi:hypothetical protein
MVDGDGLIARHRYRSVEQCVEHVRTGRCFCFAVRYLELYGWVNDRTARVGGLHRRAIAERSNDGRSLRKDQSSKQQDYCGRGQKVFE